MTIPRSVFLKLNRAYEHLLTIDNEIAGYLDREPYKIVRNVQPSDPNLVLIEFHVVSEPDERIGVILGDCIHNLRSALDHLTCCLVEKNGGTITTTTQFPILNVRPTNKTGQLLGPNIGGGVAPNVLTVIDLLQPYIRGNDAPRHPLSILRSLSNADKHRLLHITAAYLASPHCRIILPDGRVLENKSSIRVAYHETPLSAIRFPEGFDITLYGKVQVEAEGSAFVGIKEPDTWNDIPVTLLLNEICEFVRGVVVARLHPFLD